MEIPPFSMWKCTSPECGLRYPQIELDEIGGHCPRCRSRAIRLEAYSRQGDGQSEISSSGFVDSPHPEGFRPVEALLDNIRSAWNVGSMFRTADGAGMRHLHLCGITPTPVLAKIGKTALGAEQAVSWSYDPDGLEAVEALKAQGSLVWALELDSRAVSIRQAIQDLSGEAPPPPLVLVVGNENCGCDPGILDVCDRIVSIPMLGMKRSLNVAVAFGVASVMLREAQFIVG